jgi:putative transposase
MPALDPDRVIGLDPGIINSFTLAHYADEKTISVTVINGREGRAIKQRRNKTVGALQRQLSRCTPGSRKYRKLMRAKGRVQARTDRALRDFDHQVARKAASAVIDADAGRVVVGDVRGIEQKTRQRRRANRRQRQQLSQWSRGRQERYIAEKTGVELEHLNEAHSSQTCPACLTRNRPTGRNYRCRACLFACHRDAVGAINILCKAIHGTYVPIDPDTNIQVTYLRAVPRFNERRARKHRARAKARSTAENPAATTKSDC